MELKQISSTLYIAPQISVSDLETIAAKGIKTLINNRPDGETNVQPSSAEFEAAAKQHGLAYIHQPVLSGQVTETDGEQFKQHLMNNPGPVLAFCRTGNRCIKLWALSESTRLSADTILSTAAIFGYNLESLRPQLQADTTEKRLEKSHDVVIVGGGAGGIAVAASLLKRDAKLDIVIIDPRDKHYYQPGWTLVGAGVFNRADTQRDMADLIPKSISWQRAAATGFEPEQNCVVLDNGTRLSYRALIVAPGIKFDWHKIEGISDTLGKNGVTSNYLFDLAPYTWELVQNLHGGRAVFTQPPMPIKCAGAPQKAMYLSCDYWQRNKHLQCIDVDFYNAGGALFGVKEYVPALMEYVERYNAHLHFNHRLTAVDGMLKKAWFEATDSDGNTQQIETEFDMIHVCPPQSAPDFIQQSPLADAAGWMEVHPDTLQHPRFNNIFGLGDACSAPNAKTAAAVRKQAPVVAENLISMLNGEASRAMYDGYGSCPLTVERGKIVLAEFGYGGKLLPSFPTWLLDGQKPTRLAWLLKEKMLPPIYWNLMLKGHEWLAKPELLAEPQPKVVSARG